MGKKKRGLDYENIKLVQNISHEELVERIVEDLFSEMREEGDSALKEFLLNQKRLIEGRARRGHKK